MENAKGKVFKYGDNVDTDVIIPARYLNVSSGEELAKYCMIDIDKDFVNNVHKGDIIIAEKIIFLLLESELSIRVSPAPIFM